MQFYQESMIDFFKNRNPCYQSNSENCIIKEEISNVFYLVIET